MTSQLLQRTSVPHLDELKLLALEERVAAHDARMPRRNEADREIVERAKQKLMREHSLTEAEAHRKMQKQSMQHGIKMADCARILLGE